MTTLWKPATGPAYRTAPLAGLRAFHPRSGSGQVSFEGEEAPAFIFDQRGEIAHRPVEALEFSVPDLSGPVAIFLPPSEIPQVLVEPCDRRLQPVTPLVQQNDSALGLFHD
jgi:hypothetical protein